MSCALCVWGPDSIGRRAPPLEQVVPPPEPGCRDERDVGGCIEHLQLAEGIDQEHGLAGARDGSRAALRERVTPLAQQRAHGLEPLRMARDQDQQRAGMPLEHQRVRGESGLLLAVVGAACDPHRAPGAATFAKLPSRVIVAAGISMSNLTLPVTRTRSAAAPMVGSARHPQRSARRSGFRATASP